MRLRGPVRGVLGVSPFAPDESPAAVPGTEAERPSTGATLPPLPAESTGGGIVASTRAPGEAPPAEPDVDAPPPSPPPGEFPGQDDAGLEIPLAPPAEAPTGREDDAGTVPSGPATVRMIPGSPSYRVGELVTVEVRIENAANVGSVPFHLQFNRQVLEYVGPAVEGPFLSSDGSSTVFLANPSQGGTSVVVGASRLGGGEGVSGAGSLATFQFQAVNPGDAGFAFTGASVKDPQARNLPANFVAAPLRVEP
jgi:hypothetical protein